VTAWGSDLLITGPRNLLQRARARAVLGRADALIADSENLGVAARRLGAPAARTHVIPWGVDRERFAPRGSREPELIVSTRMHEPVYGMETVLAGASRVLARRPGATLVIAGEARSLRSAAARLPADRVHFAGWLDPDTMGPGWVRRDRGVGVVVGFHIGVAARSDGGGAIRWRHRKDRNGWRGTRPPVAPGDADGLAAAVGVRCSIRRGARPGCATRVIAERGDAASTWRDRVVRVAGAGNAR
jgi:glycosyltransferase involved in cell wall biosynthesis